MLLRDDMSFSLKLMLFFPLVVVAPFFGESVAISPHKMDGEEAESVTCDVNDEGLFLSRGEL